MDQNKENSESRNKEDLIQGLLESQPEIVDLIKNNKEYQEEVAFEKEVIDLLREEITDNHSRESAQIRMEKIKKSVRWMMLKKMTAAAVLFIGIMSMLVESEPKSDIEKAKDLKLDSSVTWLRDNQEEWGGWEPQKFGGKSSYKLGLSAFSAIPLSLDSNQENKRALSRSLDYLKTSQLESGSFGQEFNGSLYNQALVTLALLKIYNNNGDDSLLLYINKAISYSLSKQEKDGGFAYVEGLDSNITITSWQLHVLLMAYEHRIYNGQSNIQKAVDWMSQKMKDKSHEDYNSHQVGKSTSIMMMQSYCLLAADSLGFEVDQKKIAMIDSFFDKKQAESKSEIDYDFYKNYFSSLVLAVYKKRDNPRFKFEKHLNKHLLAKRDKAGIAQGSWAPEDPWGRVGGRLFATSFAILSLNMME